MKLGKAIGSIGICAALIVSAAAWSVVSSDLATAVGGAAPAPGAGVLTSKYGNGAVPQSPAIASPGEAAPDPTAADVYAPGAETATPASERTGSAAPPRVASPQGPGDVGLGSVAPPRPGEVEVFGPGDCNTNGNPDASDIAQGTSDDCDSNGTPDECDIASGIMTLYDQGELITHPGGGAGGANASALQTALGLMIFGYGHQLPANNRVADDFTVTDALGWKITQLTFYAYQTGSGTTSTINQVSVRIWDGVPGLAGSAMVYEVNATLGNGLLTTAFSGIYRVLDTNLVATNRPIMRQTVKTDVTLLPGTYWLDWATAGTGASGPWAPPRTILGETTTGNAMQSIAGGPFAPLVDVGPQGMPFIITGRIGNADCNNNTTLDVCEIAGGQGSDCNDNDLLDECEPGGSADCNNNGTLDLCEPGGYFDCNTNDQLDECDISGGSSDDCDGNGVPDECESGCNTNGVPDGCDISGGTSTDCDSNGTPDECDPDCNENGTPDACDISAGFSEDCQPDGIPDECQLANPLAAYQHDDGESDNAVGLVAGGLMTWLNEFTVDAGHETIAAVSVAYGDVPNGGPVTVHVWSDPNDDGSPVDAVLLATANSTIQAANTDTFITVAVPPSFVGLAGERFFVGVIANHNAGEFPAAIDQDNSQGRSWVSTTGDPNNLSDAITIDSAGIPGNWLVRALYTNDCNSNTTPDDCDIAAGAPDTNGNGVIDDCEADCNGNGTLDDIDVTVGGLPDCNTNLVPDECEDCNGNGSADACDVAAGNDCNNNNIPDDCDLAGGSSPDCNGNNEPDECEPDCDTNGTADECDVSAGAPDCQSDGIPDVCQLDVYVVDDGTGENSIGLTAGGTFIWLNAFTVQGNQGTIAAVRIAWGVIPDGTPANIYVWSDPTDDGDPSDAVLLSTTPTVVANTDTDVFNTVAFNAVNVGSNGESFYVGASITHVAGEFPARIDQTTSAERSWIVIGSNPNNLAGIALIDSFGLPGNWMVRANYDNDCNFNGTPDDCDVEPLGPLPDCNDNLSPDSCDIDRGISEDANGNNIPDECEVACALSGDMDGSGDVDGDDINCYVSCTISGSPSTGCSSCDCANLSVAAFVTALLN